MHVQPCSELLVGRVRAGQEQRAYTAAAGATAVERRGASLITDHVTVEGSWLCRGPTGAPLSRARSL